MAKKILLVEDSVTMQKVVEMTFLAEDFDLTAVSNGEEALATAKTLQPDIVITDLSLDGMTGYDICKAVKQGGNGSGAPVLLLHGSAAPYNESKAREAGADGDIGKPFETQVLIDKVRSLISTGASTTEFETEAARTPPPEPPRRRRRTVPPPLPTRGKRPTKGPPPPPPPKPRRARTTPPLPPRRPSPISSDQPPTREVPTVMAPPEAEAPKEQEIVIEAELPPARSREPLPSFETAEKPVPQVESIDDAPMDTVTLRGFSAPELPPPPDGMAVPGPAGPPRVAPSEPAIDPQAYDAIAKLSQEIIERIAWEVVPQLAEKIIREELDRLVEKPRSGK